MLLVGLVVELIELGRERVAPNSAVVSFTHFLRPCRTGRVVHLNVFNFSVGQRPVTQWSNRAISYTIVGMTEFVIF